MKKLNIFIPIILVIISMLVVKAFQIKSYAFSKEDIARIEKIKKGLIITDLFVINKKEQANSIKFANVKVKNVFEDFNCEENKNEFLCIKDEKTSFSIKVKQSYVHRFSNYDNSFIKTKRIISDKNINNDIDLFGQIKEANQKASIFNFDKVNKENYILCKFAIDELNFHSIDLIEGDYTGILLHNDSKTRELLIYYSDRTYSFTFKNLKEFSQDKIMEIMNSIIIEE